MQWRGFGLRAVRRMIRRGKPVIGVYLLFKGDNRLARPSSGESEMPMSKQIIIVIDDEQSFCDVVAEILRSFEFEVYTAYSVEGAIPLLEQHNPALIILDVMMPGIDGLTFIQHLRTRPRYANLPIIISSAKFLEKDRAAALEAGGDLYLPKPFTASDLREAITSLLPRETTLA
jgi:DNA-binding response OmpR family regulator